MVKLHFLFVFLCSFITVHSQELPQRIYNFSHYTTADGLAGNNIRGLALDQHGLLWVTSSKGLSFFDGHRFQNIDFSNSNGQPVADLGKLAIDKSGLIWIATSNQGILCYDRKKPASNAVTHYALVADQQSLVKDELYDIMVARSGLIYFAGQDTDLQVLDPVSRKVKQISFAVTKRNSHLSIFCLAEDKKGNIWVGTRYDGFFCYDPLTKDLKQVNFNNKLENGVGGFAFHGDDIYISYYDHDLVRYNPASGVIHKRLLNEKKNVHFYDNAFNCLWYDSKENQIVAGHNSQGLRRYHLNDHTDSKIPWQIICPTCQDPFKINMLLGTSYGYWVASSSGLFLYASQHNSINQIIPADQDPILNIFKVDADLWYQTAQAFGKLSADYRYKLSSIPLKGLKISQVNVDKGTIYFSTFYEGLHIYPTRSQGARLSPLPIQGDVHGFRSADCNRVFADTVDRRPILWIGTWNNGLYRYDVRSQTIACYDKTKGLPDNKIIALGRHKSGTIWLGMDGNGMIRVKDKTMVSFQQYVHEQGVSSISANKIIAFLSQSSDTLWYSSSNNGIGAVIQAGDKYIFKHFSDPNKFPIAYVGDLQRDIAGRIWMKSPDGTVVFDPNTSSFYPLHSGKGVFPPATHKTYGFYLHGPDIIWYTDRGLVLGKIQDIVLDHPSDPKPLITQFSVQNTDHSYRLHSAASITLKPFENNFTFSFTTADPTHTSNRYAYRLEGVDKEWIPSSKEQQAVYTNLSGGKYRFEVKVGDIHGNWSPQIAAVEVNLASRWFQTKWFKALCILLICMGSITIFRYRLNQQKKINRLQLSFNKKMQAELIATERKIIEQAEILEYEKQEKLKSDFNKKLYESELKAIRSQMNPHFIFNVLNSIEAYVVENDAKSASKLIHKFAALSRTVLENSQFSIVSIASEVHLVKLYLDLEQERFDNNFTYEVTLRDENTLIQKKIPSMLIQPLVENAVHHGIRHLKDRKGKILIQIYEQNQQIFIHILDNGVGFGSENQHKYSSFKSTSFGIKGIQERINMINGNHAQPIAFMHIDAHTPVADYVTQVTIVLPAPPIDEYEAD